MKEIYEPVSQRESDYGDNERMKEGHERCGGSIGLVFMALSALAFSFMSLTVHVLSSKRSLPSFEQIAFRSTTGVIMCAFWIWKSTDNTLSTIPNGADMKCLLTSRCFLGVIAMSCNWFVFTQLPLGEATIIVFSAPIFTTIIARIYLNEKVSTIQAVLMCFSTIGVVLVARPRFLGFTGDLPPNYATVSREIVFLIGIFGAVLSGITNVLVRKLIEVQSIVVVFWLMVAALVVSIPMSFGTQSPVVPNGIWVWIGLFGIGLLGFLGQVFKTQGLKWEKAGPGSMMRNLDLVFSFVFQATLLGEEIHVLSVFGASIVLIASICIGILKLRSRAAEKRKMLIDNNDESHCNGHDDIELRRFELLENPFGFSKNFAEMKIENN